MTTSTLVLNPRQTYKLKTTVKVTGKASKKVTYTSSNTKVATVNSQGKITAKKKGTAKITVRSVFNKSKKATFKLIVGTPVKKITLRKKSITAYAGKTVTLKASVNPSNASVKKLSYKTSNKKVATVNKSGKITCIAEGTAKITVTATDGSKKKAVCTVTVKKNPNDTNPTPEPEPTPEPQPTPEPTPEPEPAPDVPATDLSYEGYELKWSDDFEGDTLDLNSWNVETHQPGWVNNELQEYVNSDQNISVKDGNLIITPIKTVAENGTVSYTSGRINTQNKHDFTYGLFEVRAKVPDGQGYLPAFWMMPTNENLYGQWPRCGEIDIMEVMGQNTKKAYGTIHYGNPHSESQGTSVLDQGSYSDEYHTFSCEWAPGSIKWYVDGILYHEENDWYSTTVGQGTITYPAPFDQPFYMILNLAVGGSWVGNPDDTTDFEHAAFVVDYVKAYQKSSYDENVQKPEKVVILRDPDANGNYVNNGNFALAEDLTDDNDWVFMTALGGDAAASIAENTMTVKTTGQGTVDYSVQLVQAGIPFEKGATYQVSFDASAASDRSMKTAIKAPDHGYSEYMPSKTVALTTEKQNFSYEFKMTSDSDANGRLEFNMGAADSTANIYIRNVSIKKIKEADPNEKEVKTILADGNYVYNGSFREGTNRLGYWEITNQADADIFVTNTNNLRRLKVTVSKDAVQKEGVIVGQSDLAFTAGKAYELSFDAEADTQKPMTVIVGGNEFTANLTTEEAKYTFKLPADTVFTNQNIAFYMGTKGTIYLNNVRLVEDSLIKNGSFDAGTAGYEWYADSSADASYVVDSLTEDNAMDITIKDTGDQDWKIQLKQNNIELVNGQWYTLTFKAKSDLARKIRVVMQGTEAKDWAVYSGENIVSLTNEYQIFTKTFQMKSATDPEAFLSICLGKIDELITTQHRICIDDISLEKTDAPEQPVSPAGVNLLTNPDFSDSSDEMTGWTETIANWDATVTADAYHTVSDGAITYHISNAGTEDWHVQLKQNKISLEKDCTYTVSFKVTSTKTRTILSGVMSTSYSTYGSGSHDLAAGGETAVSYEFTMNDNDPEADFYISMGKIKDVDTPSSDITISDLSIVKNAQ